MGLTLDGGMHGRLVAVRYDDGSVHEFLPEDLRIAHLEHSEPWHTFPSYQGQRHYSESYTSAEMVWRQQYEMTGDQLCVRTPDARPTGSERLVTPFDIEARGSVKRDTLWNGYKVHLTETCDPDAPHLLTNVVTTAATVPDTAMTETVPAVCGH